MPDWPLLDISKIDRAGDGSGATYGTTITANAAANTKGSWSQLVAAMPRTAYGVLLEMFNPSTSATGFLVDIGVGGAGSEQVIVSNMAFAGANAAGASPEQIVPLPLLIPAGVRVAVRCQASAGGATMAASLVAQGATFMGLPALSRGDDYGANTGTSGSTQLDPGTTPNTEGAWVQMTASCSDVRALTLVPADGTGGGVDAGLWAVDIGIGAAAAEQVVLDNIHVEAKSTSNMNPRSMTFPLRIPSGSRIAARCRSSVSSSFRFVNLALVGWR